MIQLTPHMRIILAVEPADFRKGIDGLSQICRSVLQSDPFSGFLFVFMNKRKTAIKMLVYDGQGFWLFQKRLSKGRFQWRPDKSDRTQMGLLVHELQLLIWNGDPKSAQAAPFWKKIPL
jgi:transposase